MKLKKIVVFSVILLLGIGNFIGIGYGSQPAIQEVNAASSVYNHSHNGYKCYRIKTYMPASKVKQIAKQANKISTASNWVGALGGSYKGWIGGLAFVYGQNVQAQMTPFKNAAKNNKGLEYSYIYHDSVSSTASYSTNYSFKMR